MTITIILAAILGFVIALLKNQYTRSRANKEIQEQENNIIKKQGEIINTQKEADSAVKDYLDSLAKLDPKNWGDGGGTNH